ncbi:FHA domain-containing protein [Lipingzhangella sp. LS1_29]|uniref:FHA domain-containing protein n=1 Tax=Lipingzhangella rawalii TaxID=2055835 RepID=A0ABU2H8K2_9ACTN|nr:FHA domain-containing protein [Lipingzhangella rawalii]MDS1271645.1 FHA domain-containing protein [Lipingzhangella rawalii]
MSCPHSSVTDGYCDACGIRMTPAPSGPSVPLPPPQGAPVGVPCPNPGCGAPVLDRFCEECGTDIQAPDRPPQQPFAGPTPGADPHVSGPPATGPPPPAAQPAAHPHTAAPAPPSSAGTQADSPPQDAAPSPVTWTAIVWADPAYYQAMVDQEVIDANELTFPEYFPQRRIPLAGSKVRIGRRSRARGIEPEIDLGAPPGDPAVSARHAVLVPRPDGSWALRDEGSTNGTMVNGMDGPIDPDTEVPLADGDRIYLGAWTVITMQRG